MGWSTRGYDNGAAPRRHARGLSSLTRRDFFAGAGLCILGLGGLGAAGGTGIATVPEIFTKGHPRAFFRRAESDAASGSLAYKDWESRFLPLVGILGKVLNEEHDNAGKLTLPAKDGQFVVKEVSAS